MHAHALYMHMYCIMCMTLVANLGSGTIHYLSDGLETYALPYYKVHISVFAITVTAKKYHEQQKATEAEHQW